MTGPEKRRAILKFMDHRPRLTSEISEQLGIPFKSVTRQMETQAPPVPRKTGAGTG